FALLDILVFLLLNLYDMLQKLLKTSEVVLQFEHLVASLVVVANVDVLTVLSEDNLYLTVEVPTTMGNPIRQLNLSVEQGILVAQRVVLPELTFQYRRLGLGVWVIRVAWSEGVVFAECHSASGVLGNAECHCISNN